jgi:hypothetical protein
VTGVGGYRRCGSRVADRTGITLGVGYVARSWCSEEAQPHREGAGGFVRLQIEI